ncbi:MAG: hypothetical protein EOO54_14235 [Haliea sp.]|nr:MAG: hypothetical protein EOO54_14235 [Haliea sp.]
MQTFRANDDTLRQALAAYLHRFPDDARLRDWLGERYGDALDRTQQVEVEVEAVRAAMASIIRSTEDFLWAEPGGVDWSGDADVRLRQRLQAVHPWLDDAGFDRLVRFSRWLCWHEGLNVPATPAA